MANSDSDKQEIDYKTRLYPEDQAKVDAFIERGVNSVERKPFKPLRLVLILTAVVFGFSIFSQVLARLVDIY